MIEIYKNILSDFHNTGVPKVLNRELKVPINSGKIISVIGVRRCGKTYYLYNLIKDLLNVIPINNIIYINFEDERISKESKDLQFMFDAYYELYPETDNNDIYIFFDEIQNIKGWEKFVRRIYDTISKNIFITGSSSKLLSKEIATSLRGRAISYELYPLSFKEYLNFKGFDFSDINSTRKKAVIRKLFSEFLMKGGMPEVVNYEDEVYRKTLQSYLDVMIYRDIIERYNVKNPEILKHFISRELLMIGNKISVNKIYNELKSQGIKLTKDTLYNYLTFAQDCFLLFIVNKYQTKLRTSLSAEKKIYCIDNGFATNQSFKFTTDRGWLLENLFHIELKRKYEEFYFYQDKSECDFVIKKNNNISQAIQVTLTLNNANKEREYTGLIEAARLFKLNEGTIITEYDEYTETIEEIKINVVPVWKWLLT